MLKSVTGGFHTDPRGRGAMNREYKISLMVYHMCLRVRARACAFGGDRVICAYDGDWIRRVGGCVCLSHTFNAKRNKYRITSMI